jgi:predicted SAM-dependent methyltransferase
MNLLKSTIKKAMNLGGENFCPVCSSHVRGFKPFGVASRPNAVCPICGSLERHRLIWLYLKRETDLFKNLHKKMLHIAPEKCYSSQLKKLSHLNYLTGDLLQPAMIKIDITNIQFPDNYFDVIYCSHVLEHVPNDSLAISEFSRVLDPSGWAILQVPISGEYTSEDLSVTDPSERTRLYGQPDHVRSYGRDYKERLERGGFSVEVISYLTQFSAQEFQRYGFNKDEDDIFVCRKNSHQSEAQEGLSEHGLNADRVLSTHEDLMWETK